MNTSFSSAPLDDPHASLTDKARSYLDSNCSYCHRPSGVRAEFDARLSTPFAGRNLVFGSVNEPLNLNNPAVIVPGDRANSMIYHRVNSAGTDVSMPPLSKNLIHTEGVALLSEWIAALESSRFGNDTSTDGGFIDGHHPSLYINEDDTHEQGNGSGRLYVRDFSFYARKLGNPVTPIVVRVNGDNDFTVLAIGTTRTQSEYFAGENNFDFLDNRTFSLNLNAGDVIATGFMDSFPDGTGWGDGTVIPAEAVSGSSQDEEFGLLPNPLRVANTPAFNAGIDTASVERNAKISAANAGNELREYNLNRSYKFAITFGLSDPTLREYNSNTVPTFVNGSFEEPVVSTYLIIESAGQAVPQIVNASFEQPVVNTRALVAGGVGGLPGWAITSNFAEIDRTPWPASEGSQSMDLNATGPSGIEQTLKGLAGNARYKLVVVYALHINASAARNAEVLINDQVMRTLTADTSAKAPNYLQRSSFWHLLMVS